MSYNDIRPIFLRVWDHVNTFNPIGSEVKEQCYKPSKRKASKKVEEEKVKEEDVKPDPVLIENKAVRIRRKTLARRRASDKQGEGNSKRQKKEEEPANYEEEKEELRMWLTVVPDEEEFIDPEILHTRFPIVDWESQSLYSMHVYKIIRADGNTSYHKTFESMLKSFDRHDLEVLHRLVMERFQDNTPEGYNLMLWGDLKILVDPKQDDDFWKNQNQWKIISWKLYETCRVHTLMVDGTLMTIHMFVEKKYPLTKETLQKMLNWKLEAEAESSMAFELLKGSTSGILNTLDHLGKFDGKSDEGVLVGTGPKWLFDIDSLTNAMNYHPVSAGNRANDIACTETNSDAGQARKEKVLAQEYILLPLLHTSSYGPTTSEEVLSSPNDDDAGKKMEQEPANVEDHTLKDVVDDMLHQEKMATKHSDDARSQFKEEYDAQLFKGMRTRTSSTNNFNTVRTPLNTASASRTNYPVRPSSEPPLVSVDGSFTMDINDYPDDPVMHELEDSTAIHSTGIFGSAYDDLDSLNTPIDDQGVGAEADLNNMEPSINVNPIPTTRIHSIHPKDQIIGDPKSAVQTRRMAKKSEAGLKVNQALDDVSWVEAIQEELLQFKLLNVWTLVDLPKGKKAIGTKWVFRNKKDQRGIVVRNKARLVAQGHRQEEGIYYDEVFSPVARIEAIRLFLAYASYMDFTVYQMDVKNAFLYGTIEEEVYVNQPPGFVDLEFPNKVYKVEKALYGLHQASRACYETLSTYLLENRFRRGTTDKTLFIKKIKNDILLVQVYVDDIIFGSTKRSLSSEFEKLMHKRFQMSSMGELTFFLGLQVEQRKDGIFLSQDKYVYDILKKFGFTTVKTASTPMETHKSLSTNAAEPDVDVHLYRSMIGTLMYLTSSRPDIMFSVCACSIFQVTPKVSHMYAVKRIFRYLKGKPTLGLWYPKDSPMDLIAYSDSDYAGASIDRKSTTRGCQFLGSRLVSWQCKKQTIVANSTAEAEYIDASHCCGQVLWLQD
ncbi:putative ribonuclease H-like domain-containing protein [Tanacetum coccineum]